MRSEDTAAPTPTMALHRLYICETCERDAPLAPGEPSRGQRLSAEVGALLVSAELGADLSFLRVPCLNGCPSPCNIALRASGKYNLRFSRLTPDDARAVLEVTKAYIDHPTGNLPESEWPDPMRGKRTVCTPPPELLLGRSSSR